MLIKDTLTDDEVAMLDSPAHSALIGSILVNDYQAGYQLARELINVAKATSAGIILQFHMLGVSVNPTSTSALNKQQGLEDYISENAMISLDKLATMASINDKQPLIQMVNEQESSPYPCNFIWSNSDEVSILLYKQLMLNKKIKKKSHIYVGGVGWSQTGLDGLRNGEMSVNIGGDVFLGAAAIVTLYDYANGIKFPAATKIYNIHLMQPMTPDLMAQFDIYLPKSNWELIDFSKLSKFRNQEIKDYDFTLQNLFNNAKPNAS